MTRSAGFRVASSEDVRDNNRRIVLNLIRRHQPLSRADLARMSGMQRSTISLIVDQLLDERWILEGATGRLPRGRRPTFLHLNNDRVIIAVDIRPTRTTVAVADVNGKIAQQRALETPPDPRTATTHIARHVRALINASKDKKVEGLGVSLPGRYDHRRQRLAFAPNLKWRDFDIAGRLQSATGLDVELENAAHACVLAAVWFEPVTAPRDLVVVTVSEGIGTGIMLNGQLVRGVNGMAGEFGHVPIASDGPVCTCGNRGCWEVFGSNRAALRYFRSEAHGRVITFPDLLDLVERNDARAVAAVSEMARHLGRGLRMIVGGLAPDRILVIGDVTRVWPRIAPIIDAEVQAQVLPGGRAPRVVPGDEDGLARLRGGVALVLQKHFGEAMPMPPALMPGAGT